MYGYAYTAAPGGAARWRTVAPERTVLGVIHNVTSATRLLDLLAVFDGDLRIQTVFTCTHSSAFESGTAEFVTARGLPFLPWDEAIRQKFDLAIATSRGGELQEISAPLIGAPHGAGYNKTLSREPGAGSREPGAGSREPGAGSREPGAGSREPGAFGLTAEWLVHEGEVIPSAIVLSHDEQRARLRAGCPEAVPVSHVIGDPCMDQLAASARFRDEYRAALGVSPGQRLLLLTSTWGKTSLLGSAPDVLRRALAELPREEYRVLAAIHPNAWHGHGSWQVKSWLAPLIRAGLVVPDPETDDWKAALCAADCFIGDFGSVSLYAAAAGVPGLLAATDRATVAPGSPVEHLARLLPRVSARRPLAGQLDAAVRRQPGDPELAATARLVTSRPGEALARLRRLCYERLDLPEPPHPAHPRPVALPAPPVPAPPGSDGPARFVQADVTDAGPGEPGAPALPEVLVRGYPAGLQGTVSAHLPDAHLVAGEREVDVRWVHTADILVAHTAPLRELLERHPGCGLAVAPGPSGGSECRLLVRDGGAYTARWTASAWWTGPDTAASALYACLTRYGTGWEGDVRVRAGERLPAATLALRRVV
ncbi:hypothetical protein ADL22_00810 [Streptomyces sp. NRRL F-4489]|uniref:hypothetical protein n=1 Tax=Streptomyces sp. NRRL F-4489 TaxID=1609095 RepID=UPI00074A0F6B|nr:hypothetical protein [Streptomyces sp. NRRL F-4489]KUL55466.1 hypothetical protein ADL22_00810 [Streptomyces sp. NRRL F-4489]